jgi:hypothetical protein
MSGGDSGGPGFYTGLAMGINSATGSGFTVLTYASAIEANDGVTICTTSGC